MKHNWIATDRQYFGQPNTAYDFESTEPKEMTRRVGKLQEQKVINTQYVVRKIAVHLCKSAKKKASISRYVRACTYVHVSHNHC